MAVNGTILVVEDAVAVRKTVCTMLSQSGYRCLEAGDGIDALKTLDETPMPVDLVLTDMVMPKMTGAELGRELVRLRPRLPIVYMSGYAGDNPVTGNLDRSSVLFLTKPFTAKVLLEKVREALDQPWSGFPET